MSGITTHVLDLSLGRPARGMGVALSARNMEGAWVELARATTDADGRTGELLAGNRSLATGTYRLVFETMGYFRGLGQAVFYPEVVVSFQVEDASAHHHVPLLLSPFGYSTYRGS